MHITGEPDGPPVKVGVAITGNLLAGRSAGNGTNEVCATDLTTGLYLKGAVLAALISRSQTGEGVWIDANLFDSQVGMLPTCEMLLRLLNQMHRSLPWPTWLPIT